MMQLKLTKVYILIAAISLKSVAYGKACGDHEGVLANDVNTINISAQKFLGEQADKKVAIVVAANDGKPFGELGCDTHKGNKKGKTAFKNALLNGGGQEESIVSSMRAGLALIGVPEGKYVKSRFTKEDGITPAWGLKDIKGDLYQGGNLNEVTIQDLANGTGEAKGMKPIVHKVSNAPIATPKGSVILADLIFTAGPNFTANGGQCSSTGLTQVKDFKNNQYRANNQSEFNSYYQYVQKHLKNCYRAVLNQLDGDEDYVLMPKLSSNIYSKIHQENGVRKNSLLSKAIVKDTKSLLGEVMNERRFSNKFKSTEFNLTEPTIGELENEFNYTQDLYQTAIQERRKEPLFWRRHEELKNKKKITWFSEEKRFELKTKYDEIQEKRSGLIYYVLHAMMRRF